MDVNPPTTSPAEFTNQLIRFMEKYAGPPLHEVSGLATDWLRYVRWKNAEKLRDCVEKLAAEQGILSPTRLVPLKVVIPLLENASLEDDDTLRNLWAQLLVNAGNASFQLEITRSYISILRELSAIEAGILNSLATTKRHLWFDLDFSEKYNVSGLNIYISFWNLVRLGCLAPTVI